MNSPTATARGAVAALFADPTNGLNPNLAISCAAYGVPIVSLDFTKQTQFIQAYIDYGDTADSGYPQSNLVCLYGAGAAVFPKNSGKWLFSSQWCGVVALVADQYIGIKRPQVQNFEPFADAAESAMLTTMNSAINAVALKSSGLLYNQEISCLRRKAVQDGDSWIVPLRFTMSFEVYL